MKDIISGHAFDHNKKMTEGFIKSRIVRGGSNKIEQVMRTAGCDPLNPSAAVAVYLAEATGKVNTAKLVLAGTMPHFELSDISSIFPDAPKTASMKFDNINLTSLRFMTSQMATRWSPDSEFSWSLLVDGLDEEGQPERVTISPKNFPKYKVSNICMRVMAQPISVEKMKITIGIAPVPYKSLEKTNDFDDIGFPMVEVNTFTVDIFPQEDKDTNHGIGVQPYILAREELNILPTSADIKAAVCDLLASSIMPTSKKSTKRWLETISKGEWSARESSKEWLSPLDSDKDSFKDDVSGKNLK